ncbi:hypothetical protein CLU85_1873 [Acidovorax sp. 69]|uniref:hypothetical protein n=1 Tax=Acidovorax sp. 69 TaxID=2035202 RepID=UPI000C24BF34|nr:hypothetical protein [Acidovorax sp. 69]PJI97104.1 hypothetical protein CLU85_1873 [Acidovorax sp. 69]
MLSTNLTLFMYRPSARRLRGFGLLQVLLLISVMAGLATMGYLQWRERTAIESSRQERQALAQADQAIIAFATVMRRLPCPDTNRDGEEDCGALADQKGWLPSTTLRLAGADPGVDVGQLRYLVQRGAGGNNLTELTDSWRPLEYDEDGQTFSAMRAGGYPNDILTLTDLCQRLETARTTAPGAALARVNATPLRSVAYALAHPGNNDADGDGDLFDGANSNAGGNANLMEDPVRRPVLAVYNDIVLERSFASLQSSFHCQPLIDSINTVALGHDVVEQVAEMRADNIEAAQRAVAFSTLAAVMTGLEIVLAVAEGISDAGNAAAEWVICAASLGLAVNACAAAPQHTVAIGLAGGVVYANIAAVALNATAAGIAGTALTLADDAATPAQVCPPRDQTLVNQMLANAKTERTNAANARAAVQTEVTNKTNELNAAIAVRTAAIANLRAVLRGNGASSQIDDRVDPLLTAALEWGNNSFNNEVAQSNLSRATEARDVWADKVASYDAMLTDSAASLVRLNSDIATLDAQIAATSPADTDALNLLRGKRASKLAEIQMLQSIPAMVTLRNEIAALDAQIATNPPNKAELQAQRARKARELDSNLFASARADAVSSLASAQAALDTAVADRDTAASNFSLSQTRYQNAFSNLLSGSSRYAIYNGNGDVIGYRCTSACTPGDVDVTSALNTELWGLFGFPGNVSPSTDATYLKPLKLQKELDALNAKLAAARTREINAQAQVDQMQQMVDNPAACNVTGSAVIPMTPAQAEAILVDVDRKGGTR